MKQPKLDDLMVRYSTDLDRPPLPIHVRNTGEALAVLAAIEAVTAYDTVHDNRRDARIHTSVHRYELTPTGGGWLPVQDWELDAAQNVLDAA